MDAGAFLVDALGSDWVALVLRWIHVTVGIAWIGSSFLFNWMDSQFEAVAPERAGVAGEMWMVHGGGFYRVEKYLVAPERLPRALHWFKWEAYSTWLSGFALLAAIYFLGAPVYLVDAETPFPAPVAVVVALALLAAGWFVYDGLCRLLVGRAALLLAALVFAWTAAVAAVAGALFSGRAAYILVGAMLGTIMAANVFRVIIPNQKRAVAALLKGEKPEPRLGIEAKQRSLHNNYITLPVLFVMVSNHYPVTYGQPYNWAILAGLGAVGVAVRHFFNLRNRGRAAPWILVAAAAGMIALALVASPRPPREATAAAGGSAAPFRAVAAIVKARCAVCHSARPSYPGFDAPPKGLVFDRAEDIRAAAARIYAQAVETEAMPLGNVTGMTADERAILGRWIGAGAPLDAE